MVDNPPPNETPGLNTPGIPNIVNDFLGKVKFENITINNYFVTLNITLPDTSEDEESQSNVTEPNKSSSTKDKDVETEDIQAVKEEKDNFSEECCGVSWECRNRHCHARFWDKVKLVEHEINEHLFCGACEEYFTTLISIMKHVEDIHLPSEDVVRQRPASV